MYDRATGYYHEPFISDHRRYAERIFAEHVTNPHSRISKYPHEFQLVQIGQYDIMTGNVENLPEYRYICNGIDVDTGNDRRQQDEPLQAKARQQKPEKI